MWLEACTPGIAARVVGQANPFWVLEPSAAPGRFYIRDSRCAPTSGKPAYLGYHKTVCTQLSPRLYNKTTPWADMLWTLSLVSAGTSGINDGDVRAGNVVMLWIRKATGPGARAPALPTASGCLHRPAGLLLLLPWRACMQGGGARTRPVLIHCLRHPWERGRWQGLAPHVPRFASHAA